MTRSNVVAIGLLVICTAICKAQTASHSMVRVRVPAQPALAAADVQIDEQFQNEMASAVTPEDMREVAKRLSAAAATSVQLAERYVLRQESALLSARAGDWRQALQQCDQLCGEFNVQQATAHSDIIAAIADNLVTARANGLDDATMAALLVDCLEGLLVEDNYNAAQRLWPYLNARVGFSATAEEYQALIARLQQLYNSQALPAFETLKTDSLHAGAHQTLGDFYFSQKGDWEAALPHYVLGTNAAIKKLAIRELTHPQEHADHHALANDYQMAMNQAANANERDWFNKRLRYWRAVAATSERQFSQRFGPQPPMLPPQPEDVASFAPRVGHNMLRRGTPAGASLLLNFDQNAPRTGIRTLPVATRSNSSLSGERVTLFDLSPRRSHVEGLLYTGNTYQGITNNGWRMHGTSLACTQRLLGQLPAFTWTGWVLLNGSSPETPMFQESPTAPSWPPEINQQSLQFAFDGKKGLRFLSPLAHQNFTSAGLPGFTCSLEQGSLYDRWVFMAVTVDYAQRVRVTMNHRTVSTSLGPLGRRSELGTTFLAATEGQLDNVTFYPRPLSEAEVTTLYHRGLTRQPLAEYVNNGSVSTPPPVEFPPLLYHPLDTVAGSNNNPNNTPAPAPNNPPSDPSYSPAPPKAKTAKPSDAEIKEARALIRELYAADFTKATNTEKRRELASKLKQVGRDSKDSAASRYACMFEAADLLSDAEVPEAYDAWDELAKEFDVGVAREKGLLLDRMQKKAKLPTDHKYLADRYVRLLNEALDHDDYPLAMSLGTRAEACVKRAGDDALEKTIDKGIKDIRQMMAAYDAAKAAKEKLATTPDDAPASAAWGRYLCLYRGKWDEGLPLLQRGADELATLAKTDRSGPGTTKLQTDLAAAWWKAADTEKDERAQTQLRSRAVFWYQKVAPSATGIQAAQIKQRIADHQAAVSTIPTKKPFDALSMVDISAHGLRGTWQKDRGAIAVIPDRSSGSEVVIPVALHGSYEMATRIDWQGRTGALVVRLPVGDKNVLLTLGSGMGLENAQGGNLNGVKLLHPAASLDQGRRYDVTTAVVISDEEVEINVGMNARPYLSWSGPLKDLDTGNFGNGFGGGGGFGRPNRGAPSTEPVIRFHGRTLDPYALLMMQLNITRGWADPVMQVGPAIGSSRTGS